MRGGRTAAIAAIVLTLAVPGAGAQPLPRIEAAVELGVQSFQSSDYGEVLSAFDHAPLRWGFQANAHVLRVLTPRLRVGAPFGTQVDERHESKVFRESADRTPRTGVWRSPAPTG